MKSFIDLAAEAAEDLKTEYANEPELEFLSWLRIALEREAMVSEAYDADFVDDQLSAWKYEHGIPVDVIAVIRRSLMGVWTQEEAHHSYFAALLREVNPPKELRERIRIRLDRVRGRLEGQVLGNLVSGNPLFRYPAKLAIIIGARFDADAVPEYLKSLRRTSFSQFCSMNQELEQTAVLGYRRMLTLGRQIMDSDLLQDTPVMVDLARTMKDECYHEALFRALTTWPPPPGRSSQPQKGSRGLVRCDLAIVNVSTARDLISTAKERAYGDDAEVLGGSTVAVNVDNITDDPLVSHMRRYCVGAADDEDAGQGMLMA